MRSRRLAASIAVLATLVSPVVAVAAETVEHTIAIYGWVPWFDGDTEVGGHQNGVDIDGGEVLDSLELTYMTRYRAQGRRWAMVFDGQYASLGDQTDDGVHKELDLNQYIFQLDGAYRVNEAIEVLGGVRYVRIETEADLGSGPLAVHREGDASLWDPVVGVRTVSPVGSRLLLHSQLDIGGGANMDLTWQAMINFGWIVGSARRGSLWLGYRAIGMDFDDAGNDNGLSMDVIQHGPQMGAAFHF